VVRMGSAAPSLPFARVERSSVPIRLVPGSRLYAATPDAGRLEVLLHVGWIDADDVVMEALAAALLERPAKATAAGAVLTAYAGSEAFGEVEIEIREGHRPTTYVAKGRVHDLDQLFDQLNARYFDGALERPKLDWRASASRRNFGAYVASYDLVVIDMRLDREDVPEEIVSCVLYHELLHKKHGVTVSGGRRSSHSAAFRRDEARHPAFLRAEAFLGKLAGRDAQVGTKPPPSDMARTKRPAVRSTRRTTKGAAYAPPAQRPDPPEPKAKVGRNVPCPCGSGHKYKRCCGKA